MVRFSCSFLRVHGFVAAALAPARPREPPPHPCFSLSRGRMRAPGWTGRRRSVFRQIWRQLKRANQRAKNKRGRVDCRRERQRRTLAAAVACWRQLTHTSVHADTDGCVHTGTCVPACEDPLAHLARACSPILDVHACMIAHRNARTFGRATTRIPRVKDANVEDNFVSFIRFNQLRVVGPSISHPVPYTSEFALI